MVNMRLIKCDRCGRIVNAEEDAEKIYIIDVKYTRTGTLQKRYDVCTACLIDLEKVLKDGQRGKKNDTDRMDCQP